MPEGPEVETIRRGLEMSIVGQTLKKVDVLWERSWVGAQETAEQVAAGAKVTHVARRAKVLLIELDNEYSLMFHLKMTGQLVLAKVDGERYSGGHPSLSMIAWLPDNSTRV